MKLVLALVAGAVLGAAALRLARPTPAPERAVPDTTGDAGPERVAVDVSAFTG